MFQSWWVRAEQESEVSGGGEDSNSWAVAERVECMLRGSLVKLYTPSCVPPNLHSGKSPVLPFFKCFPRNQPSPKSSSRSISSIRSPLARLNSSALRAENSSAEYQLLVQRDAGSERSQVCRVPVTGTRFDVRSWAFAPHQASTDQLMIMRALT